MYTNHTRILGILVTLSLALTACGGEQSDSLKPRAEGSGDKPVEQESLCPVDDYTCNPSEEEFPNAPPTKLLTVRLKNASGITRECSKVDVARYASSTSGALVITTVAPGGLVDSGGAIVGSMSLTQGTSVSANGGCWRVGSPSLDYVYGSFPVTMTTNKDCTITYSEGGGYYASARMDCTSY